MKSADLQVRARTLALGKQYESFGKDGKQAAHQGVEGFTSLPRAETPPPVRTFSFLSKEVPYLVCEQMQTVPSSLLNVLDRLSVG